MGLAYVFVFNLRTRHGALKISQVRFWTIFGGLALLTIAICVVLYRISPEFRTSFRFGFEGFFNWVETGEFRTGSTDILQTMWVWPTTQRGWIIGEGIIGVLNINSDIGYCNFVFYCGLIGLTIFSIYFIYNQLCLNKKFDHFFIVSIILFYPKVIYI